MLNNDRFFIVFIYFVVMASGIFMGCNPQQKEALPSIDAFIADSVYLPLPLSDHFKSRVREVEGMPDDKEVILFVKSSNFKAYFYDISKGVYAGDSFSLVNYANEYNDSYPLGIDSLMVGTENEVISISKSGTRKWDISGIVREISPYAYVGYLSKESLHVFSDTVACITTTNEDYKQGEPNVPFLKTNYNILIKLLPDTAVLLAIHNPNPIYLYKQDYYTDLQNVYLNSGKIVYSYSHSDTIATFDLFKNKETSTKLRTENFAPNGPFDHARVFDFRYIDSFSMEQPRMSQLFYDKAHHRIYATLKHKGTYIEASGKKNDWEDLPFSLFVLDEQLNQLQEIYIPPGNFGPIYRAFITHRGLYIPAATSKQKYHDKTLFYRIVIP